MNQLIKDCSSSVQSSCTNLSSPWNIINGFLSYSLVDATSLCESEASLVVDLEDLLDGRDVGRGTHVKAKVVLLRRVHDVLQLEQVGRQMFTKIEMILKKSQNMD